MKKFLVPTDFTQEAQTALKVAVDMAKTANGEVTLLNVVDAPSGANFSAQGTGTSGNALDDIFTIKLIEKMKADLEEMVEPFGEDAPIKREMALGDVIEQINLRADKEGFDLVIMGTKGSTGMHEVMVGSNAEKVVRNSKIPVLTVKHDNANVDPKNIVFASDFSEDYSRVVPKLKDFQKQYDATLHLLFVNTPNKFELSSQSHKRMKDFVKKYGLKNYTLNVYNHRDEEDGILSFAEENKMDLIAVATHSRKGLAHLLSGSIAEGIVNHSSTAVLSYSLKHLAKK